MCVTRTRGRADKVIASVVISRVWWDQALAQLPPSTSENITKPWNHKISIVERISQGIWSNLPPLTGLSFDRVCAWIPQAAGNSLLPRPASPDWGKSYLLLISLPHSCWLSSLKPGEWARFLSCVWQPFRIDICFCRITEFYSWRGTSDSWFCYRGENWDTRGERDLPRVSQRISGGISSKTQISRLLVQELAVNYGKGCLVWFVHAAHYETPGYIHLLIYM